jgi:hypothetical protein
MTRKTLPPKKAAAKPAARPTAKSSPTEGPAAKTLPASDGKKSVAKALTRKRTPQVARELLVVEMRRVRAIFVEIGERYLADIEGSIVSIIDDLAQRKLPPDRVERLLKEVRELDVKPRKGRRKDLGRIESLVDTLRKSLED